MTVELSVAITAVLVSVISFGVNLRAANAAERHGRMPVLVPQPFEVIEGEQVVAKITIRNIGNGPALNIVIATATAELAAEDALRIRLSRRKYRNHWSGYMHLQPIASGTERCYRWDYGLAVGLSYTDALGKPYTLLTSAYGTKVVDGAAMSHPPLNRLQYPESG